MSANSFGKLFTLTTFGESHGSCIGGVVDGCPPGLRLAEADLQAELDRRKPGQSRYTSQRRESDQIQILSGVYEGKTTGTPIGLLIKNSDARDSDYADLKDVFRPGHADYTYFKKYGIRDHRGGGRASARETALRVAAGAIAKKYLFEQHDIRITGYLSQIGPIKLDVADLTIINANPFFCPDPAKVSQIEALINQLRKEGDSIGARINVIAESIPVGLGEPVYDKLDADIAKAMMSINAVKGVDIGDGFLCVEQKGSEHRDEMSSQGFLSNHAGGILGGISTGQPLMVSIAVKPTSSIVKPARTVTVNNEEVEISVKGRHDPCVGIRAVPVAEAMLAIVLMDHIILNGGMFIKV